MEGHVGVVGCTLTGENEANAAKSQRERALGPQHQPRTPQTATVRKRTCRRRVRAAGRAMMGAKKLLQSNIFATVAQQRTRCRAHHEALLKVDECMRRWSEQKRKGGWTRKHSVVAKGNGGRCQGWDPRDLGETFFQLQPGRHQLFVSPCHHIGESLWIRLRVQMSRDCDHDASAFRSRPLLLDLLHLSSDCCSLGFYGLRMSIAKGTCQCRGCPRSLFAPIVSFLAPPTPGRP